MAENTFEDLQKKLRELTPDVRRVERTQRENPAFTYYLPWQSPKFATPQSDPSEYVRQLEADAPSFDGKLVVLDDFFQAE